MSVKKIIITSIISLFFGFSANAQFSAVGGRAGIGFAKFGDDLFMHSTTGLNVGGFVKYSFSIGSLPEMELQSGLSLVRKGSKMEKTDLITNIVDVYHPWYLQVPLLLVYTYRLPIADEHFVNFSIGPAANIGLFGTRQRTIISPDYVGVWGPEWNSQTKHKIFDEWEKFDLSLIISLGYRFRDLTFDFVIDKSFFIPMEEKDALFDDRNSFTGTQQAFMFMLGYHFSLK